MWNTLGRASQEKRRVECPREKRKGEEERMWRPSMGVGAADFDALEILGEVPLNRHKD